MNVRERVHAVLTGGEPDKVPFTIYWQMVPKGEAGRRLREKGLGFWWRQSVLAWEYPNCDIKEVFYAEKGEHFRKVIYSTPVGEVTSLYRTGGLYGSDWQMTWPIKEKDDYRVMEFVANDARPVERFEAFERMAHNLGGDGYPVADFMYTPIMELIVRLVGYETSAYHMADYSDAFWSLCEVLNNQRRRAYKVCARGPQKILLYGGNCHPHVLGRERFEKHVVACLDEMADILHEEGKLVGAHLDADNGPWRDIVAASKIDMVEAFTPPPDCDMSVAEAREAWPEKILGVNFPSSLHLAAPDVIREAVRKILEESDGGRGIIMGITENVPEDRWEMSLDAMADAINEFGRFAL